jgi:hypothetical protein
MCLICIEFQKENITVFEARNALGEMRDLIGEEHAEEVEDMIEEVENLLNRRDC